MYCFCCWTHPPPPLPPTACNAVGWFRCQVKCTHQMKTTPNTEAYVFFPLRSFVACRAVSGPLFLSLLSCSGSPTFAGGGGSYIWFIFLFALSLYIARVIWRFAKVCAHPRLVERVEVVTPACPLVYTNRRRLFSFFEVSPVRHGSMCSGRNATTLCGSFCVKAIAPLARRLEMECVCWALTGPSRCA